MSSESKRATRRVYKFDRESKQQSPQLIYEGFETVESPRKWRHSFPSDDDHRSHRYERSSPKISRRETEPHRRGSSTRDDLPDSTGLRSKQNRFSYSSDNHHDNDQYLSSPDRPRGSHGDPTSSPKPISPQMKRVSVTVTKGATVEEFKTALGVDRESSQRHVEEAWKNQKYLDVVSRARGTTLLRLCQFRDLMESRNSALIVVHANEDKHNNESFSSMSAQVSMLCEGPIYDSKSKLKPTPMVFFCGPNRDANGSATGMVFKMLCSFNYTIAGFTDRGEYTSDIVNEQSIKNLNVRMLSKLIKIMSIDTIIDGNILDGTFLVDGANFLETPENISDLEIVLQDFEDLIEYTRQVPNGSTVKLVLFFPRKSEIAYKWASKGALIEVTNEDVELSGALAYERDKESDRMRQRE